MKKKSKILSFEQIAQSDDVQKSIEGLVNLSRPKGDINKYLNNINKLYNYDTDVLEKYLSRFIAWQNYFGEQVIIADAIRVVAESQCNYIYSRIVNSVKGSINERKEKARANPLYKKALDIWNRSEAYYNGISITFDNCDRGYKLTSRILTKRLGIKEW